MEQLSRAEKHAAVVKWLGRQLKEAKWDTKSSRRFRYKSVPFKNDLTCVGIDLETLMLPVMPSKAVECEAAFDGFVFAIHRPDVAGEFDKKVGLTQGLGHERAEVVLHWLKQWDTDEEQVVMLAWALGHADGASVEVTDNSIMVNVEGVEFGIRSDGSVVGKFSHEFVMPVSGIDELLTRVVTMKSSSSKFATLYREAYRRGDHVVTALIAFASGCEVSDIWKLVQKTRPPEKIPSIRDMQKMEHILMKKEDPFGELYKYLVPVWMQRASFSRLFGAPRNRNLEPRPHVRQSAVERLTEHYEKKKGTKK